jgi:serine kinase of HPr protein (carbohydrate metabolism regulator)
LGDSVSGKSTLAVALSARGHAMVADDIVAVNCDCPFPVVFPGFPQLKIWPETVKYSGIIAVDRKFASKRGCLSGLTSVRRFPKTVFLIAVAKVAA